MGREDVAVNPREVPAAGGPAERGRELERGGAQGVRHPGRRASREFLPEALALLAEDGVGRDVESVFVIGGASLYREALATPGLCERVHITNVLPAEGRRARSSRGRCRLRVRRLLPRAPRGRLPARVTDGRSDGRHAMGHAAFLLRDGRRRLRRLRCPVGAPGGARQRSRGATVPESRPRRD